MKHILQFSYLYPNLSTLIILLVLGLFVYFFARFLAFVFSNAEKKAEQEPGIMTEVDRLKTELEQVKTESEAAKNNYRLRNEHYNSLYEIANSYRNNYILLTMVCNTYKQCINNTLSEKDTLLQQISDLEKQLAKLNLDLTVITSDRDELKQYVVQLEQHIDEDKELYNNLIDDYNESLNKVAKYRKKLGKSYSEIARIKVELRNCKLMIQEITIPDPSQLYVAADSDGLIHVYKNKPNWTGSYWNDPKSKFKLFVAYDICYKLLGRIQGWDEDPTQVPDKIALIKMIAKDVNWIATNLDGKIYMYRDRPFRNFEKNVWVTLSTYAVKANSSDIEQKIGFVTTWQDDPIPVTVD